MPRLEPVVLRLVDLAPQIEDGVLPARSQARRPTGKVGPQRLDVHRRGREPEHQPTGAPVGEVQVQVEVAGEQVGRVGLQVTPVVLVPEPRRRDLRGSRCCEAPPSPGRSTGGRAPGTQSTGTRSHDPDLPSEDPGHEPVPDRLSDLGGHKLTDALPNRVAAPDALGCLHRVRVGRPDVGGGDLIAVALDEPVQREHPGLHREPGLRLRAVPRGPRQHPRVARAPPGQLDRRIIEFRVLGRREPPALLSGRARDQVAKHRSGLPPRVLAGDRAERRRVGRPLVRHDREPLVRLLRHPRQHDLLTPAQSRGRPRPACGTTRPDGSPQPSCPSPPAPARPTADTARTATGHAATAPPAPRTARRDTARSGTPRCHERTREDPHQDSTPPSRYRPGDPPTATPSPWTRTAHPNNSSSPTSRPRQPSCSPASTTLQGSAAFGRAPTHTSPTTDGAPRTSRMAFGCDHRMEVHAMILFTFYGRVGNPTCRNACMPWASLICTPTRWPVAPRTRP